MKSNLNYNEFCQTYPKEFILYFNYVRKLQFEEKPDYVFLKNLFKKVNIKEKNINLLNGETKDPEKECRLSDHVKL